MSRAASIKPGYYLHHENDYRYDIESVYYITGSGSGNLLARCSYWNNRAASSVVQWHPLSQRHTSSARRLSQMAFSEELPVQWASALTPEELLVGKALNEIDTDALSEQTKIAIPTIGSVFRLVQPWNFMLYVEHRNHSLYNAVFGTDSYVNDARSHNRNQQDGGLFGRTCVLPTGTRLKVDRIYIRKGIADYDSVTLVLPKKGCPDNPTLHGRFWVKLHDINRISCQWELATLRRVDNTDLLTRMATALGE